MACIQTKNPNLGKFWRVLHRLENVYIFNGHLEDFWRSEIFYDHLVHFVFIWYIFFRDWYHVPRKIWQPCCIVPYMTLKLIHFVHPSNVDILFCFCFLVAELECSFFERGLGRNFEHWRIHCLGANFSCEQKFSYRLEHPFKKTALCDLWIKYLIFTNNYIPANKLALFELCLVIFWWIFFPYNSLNTVMI
jgi:hypothetical protein